MPFGKALQFDAQVVCVYQAHKHVSVRGGGDVKLGRLPGWNPARAEHPRFCIYAFVERQATDQEINDQAEPIANICNDSTCVPAILSVKKDKYTRSAVKMELDLAPG